MARWNLKTLLKQRQSLLIGGLLAASLLSACSGQPTVILMQITNTPDPRLVQVTVTNTAAVQPSSASGAAAVTAATSAAAATTIAVIPATAVPATAVPASVVPSTAAPAAAATTIPSGASGQPTSVAIAPTSGSLPTGVPATISSASTIIASTPVVPGAAPASGGAATPNAMPTDTRAQLYIAQEDFQHGYMFWIGVRLEIWVLVTVPGGTLSDQPPTSGQWLIFHDTFVDGEPETDPSMVPPSAALFQPRRGFGKLWRNNDQIRGLLGWGTTPEFGLTTSYVYQPGGSVNTASGQWQPGPGTHFIVTLGRDTFAFHEPQPGQQYGTWEKVG